MRNRFFFDHSFYDGNLDIMIRFMWQIMLVAIVLCLMLSAVFLIFQGLGMHRMAKRKGLSNAWMGFVPVLNYYLLGKLSNMPDRRRRSDVVMLVLAILTTLFSVICLAYIVPLIGMSAREAIFSPNNLDVSFLPDFFGIIAMFTITMLIACGLAVALTVLMFIALHRIYRQFSPDNATVMTVFTVLSTILLGVPIHPFLLFAIRNNEIWPMGKPSSGYNGPQYPPNIPKYNPYADYAQSTGYDARQQPAQQAAEPRQTPTDDYGHSSPSASQGSYTTSDASASLSANEEPIAPFASAEPPAQPEPPKQPEPPEQPDPKF